MKKTIIFATLVVLLLILGCSFYKKAKSDEPLDLNINNKYKFDLAFNVPQHDNMQGLTYNNAIFYISFDMGQGKGVIRKYDINGKFIKETKQLALGHSAGLAYRTSNGHVYACNGGGTNPTFVYEIDMTATTPSIISILNFNNLGNSALLAVNNDMDELIIHTAANGSANPTFSICKFDGTIIKQFTLPNQGVPQGLDYYKGQLYFYTNNKITVMDLNGKLVKILNVKENGESEGLAIGVQKHIPFIAIGYNSPNRIYILSKAKNNKQGLKIGQ